MANTYTWTFPTLQTYTHQEGLENVVYIVHWYYTGNSSPESGSYSYQLFGAQTISPFVSGSRPFIPYEQLTEAIVQEWVEESLGSERLESMRSSIDYQIDSLINPPIAYLPPPWATPTPTPEPTSDPLFPAPTPTPSPTDV
jgi:hypothetical protein